MKMIKRISEKKTADKALADGFISINNTRYTIEKQPRGWCDGCSFYPQFLETSHCPSIAMKICCTGGNILIKQEQNK